MTTWLSGYATNRDRDEWGDPVHHVICDEAADEIARLRAALADERAHADAPAEWAAECRQAIIAVDGTGNFAKKVEQVIQAAEWLDDTISKHRGRRQG
ncbi:hypothetical protein [Paracoccus sp. (in: a-proteobacteria)]|uniref:hypothetical protein n=1 Tax=Paracoccus sp. TaxID=267 RepID=UPI0028ACC104|nr:hypothetical protein [Paracoccus sp. (in: a-proteobacteria)]